jgi:outer membrane protein TolC
MKQILSLLLIFLVITVYGYGPQQVANYRSQEYNIFKEKVTVQEQKLRVMKMGLDGTLKINRASQQTETGYTLGVIYQFKPENVTDAEAALIDAKNALDAEARGCTLKGMNLYADHLTAISQLKSVQLQMEIAKVNWTEADRKNKIGALAAIDLQEAKLDLEDAEISLKSAENDLKDITNKAKLYNFSGEPEFIFPRYIPVEIDASITPEMKSLVSSAIAAKGRYRAANRETQIGLSLDLSKYGGDIQVMTSVSTRTRSANFTFGYPSLYDPAMLLYGKGWRTSVNLEIPLSPSAESGVKTAKVEYDNINAKIIRRKKELAQEISAAKSMVENEEKRLELSSKRCDIAKQRIDIATIKYDSGAISLVEKLKTEKDKLDMDIALTTTWKRYTTAVGNYIDIIGGFWNIIDMSIR